MTPLREYTAPSLRRGTTCGTMYATLRALERREHTASRDAIGQYAYWPIFTIDVRSGRGKVGQSAINLFRSGT